MNARTSYEREQIERLSRDFLDIISRAKVDGQIALDALEYTLDTVLLQACQSEEVFVRYIDMVRDRALAAWRRKASANTWKTF